MAIYLVNPLPGTGQEEPHNCALGPLVQYLDVTCMSELPYGQALKPAVDKSVLG